ncbi:MAG: hypothetical protein WCY93_11075 [Anaerolineaceae bacterium]
MSNINFGIDWFQEMKRQFVRATVEDEVVKKGLIQFVDDQTALAKTIVKNQHDFTKVILDKVM